ncbi:hypothetical protein OG777_16980 [Micromonospora peucetia]|uniref:Uncharacterized protein n=1 Tax=Micromonospora peucetia TaxID=47871 RepID=A0ABZ1EAX3_9ACTN|nr:hypothetical protein [Micromonospora peucetia]MCX4388618.1 hypothetical protein [Micromonospora peucetia]WSA30731.1 hypothetical protein OIE14_21490 [Micromonospora peucetia]
MRGFLPGRPLPVVVLPAWLGVRVAVRLVAGSSGVESVRSTVPSVLPTGPAVG